VPNDWRIPIASDADVVLARQQGRRLAEQAGFTLVEQTLIATAISELARNIVRYAQTGEVVLRLEQAKGRPGFVLIAQDTGPGIADIAQALQDGYSSGDGLGMGLPGTRRLMDHFEIVSQPGAGTTVTVKKWRT
jgi:serine/threonine-protein kinase RsbT